MEQASTILGSAPDHKPKFISPSEIPAPPARYAGVDELITQAERLSEAQAPEIAAEPSVSKPTLEDYIDSLEGLEVARRTLALVYHERESQRLSEVDIGFGLLSERERKQITSRQRPDWEEHFPKDGSSEEQARWDEYVLGFGSEKLQRHLRRLYKVSKRHQEISQDPDIKQQIEQHSEKRMMVMREVAAFRHLERRESAIIAQLESLSAQAAMYGDKRWEDNDEVLELRQDLQKAREAKGYLLKSTDALNELERRRSLDAKRSLMSGIVMTEPMKQIELERLPSLMRGEPLLLIGETGGAKSQLAKYLAKRVLQRIGSEVQPLQVGSLKELVEELGLRSESEKKPMFYSASAETSSYQLLGKEALVLDEDAKQTVTKYVLGKLGVAMAEGLPIVIDEFNALPPEVSKSLNEILLLRPGTPNDEYTFDDGRTIKIKPGFCVIATMNQKIEGSNRYLGINALSADTKSRFSPNISEITYPDLDIPTGVVPPTLWHLATLAITDPVKGTLDWGSISEAELKRFVRLAHVTQDLYVHSAANASSKGDLDLEDRSKTASGGTVLEGLVIDPRLMVRIIEEVRENPDLTFQRQLSGILALTEKPSDRAIFEVLLDTYGFLEPKSESQPGVSQA